MIISDEECFLAQEAMRFALGEGMDGVRVTLSKSVSNSLTMLDGEIDNTSRCADSSLTFCLFADSRYGTFSTNRLEMSSLRSFLRKACETVRLMEQDPFRGLPQKERMASDAVTGLEAGLWDGRVLEITPEQRLEAIKSMRLKQLEGCVGLDGEGKTSGGIKWSVASEEDDYADYAEEIYLIDSQGFEGRSLESSVSCSSEVTVLAEDGRRYSAYWWDASAKCGVIHPEVCAATALGKALEKIGPQGIGSGVYRAVVDGNIASKLLSPVIDALGAFSLQQKMSFLVGSKGKKVFSEGLTLTDKAREKGKQGARMFDSEGVATCDRVIIEDGRVKNYFVNTYMSRKMGEAPTVEDISRPVLSAWNGFGKDGEKALTLEDIVRECGEGVLIGEFNGGNCNPVTGDYSFGVAGFVIRGGKVCEPFREMLMTGNIVELWNSLLAVGDDARECGRWKLPTLAFEGVSLNA